MFVAGHEYGPVSPFSFAFLFGSSTSLFFVSVFPMYLFRAGLSPRRCRGRPCEAAISFRFFFRFDRTYGLES